MADRSDISEKENQESKFTETSIQLINAMLAEQLRLQTIYIKKVLTLDEAVVLTGFGRSTLYALTSTNQIPHSKPTGGTLFFDREALENWMLGNPIKTKDEINQIANAMNLNNTQRNKNKT